MSDKARFYGLPTPVINDCLAAGVHPDCLLTRRLPKWACTACVNTTHRIVTEHYGHIPDPVARMNALAADVEKEQASE